MYKLGGPSVVGELATISMLVGKAGLTWLAVRNCFMWRLLPCWWMRLGPSAMDCVSGDPRLGAGHFGLGPRGVATCEIWGSGAGVGPLVSGARSPPLVAWSEEFRTGTY